MQTEDDITRRRKMMQEALTRGLQRPETNPFNASAKQSFMPGESAGMPDSFWNEKFPFLRSTQGLREQQPGYAPVGGDGSKPSINVPPNAGLTLPQPAPANINVAGPSQPSEPSAQPTTPRIGYSTAGLSGLDAIRERRKALEEADPESKVTRTGEILPPEKTGRFKGAGLGLSAAANNIDPNRPMFSLGQLLGGGVKGLVAPRSAAKDAREVEMRQLDNDYVRGLKLKEAEAQVDRATNPVGQMSTRVVSEGEYPGIEAGTEIRVRVDPRTGSITDVVGPNSKPVVSDLAKRPAAGSPHYEKDSDGYLITVQGGQAKRVTGEDGQPVKVKKGDDGEYVEVEINGRRLKVTPGQALNYYGQVGEKESKYSAAKSEYDSLVEAERVAGEEKNRAYQVLDDMRKSGTSPKEDIAQAEQDAQKANDYYRTFGEKKKDAARRMQENEVRQSGQYYAGRTMSRANLERYAKDKGLSVEDAQRDVEAQGVRVQ